MTNHTALVQSLLATCDRLGMTNIPAGAPAAFARVLDAAPREQGTAMTGYIDIVFETVPRDHGPDDSLFIEVENSSGSSIALGEWVKRSDGYWVIRVTPEDFAEHFSLPRAEITIPATAWAALLGAFEKRKQQDRGRTSADAIWDAVIGEIQFSGSGPGNACRAAAKEIAEFATKDTAFDRTDECKAEIASIIARHLPSDRYGEGFAAGVEAAIKMAEMEREKYHKASDEAPNDKRYAARCLEAAGVISYLEGRIRALTQHGDDHG